MGPWLSGYVGLLASSSGEMSQAEGQWKDWEQQVHGHCDQQKLLSSVLRDLCFYQFQSIFNQFQLVILPKTLRNVSMNDNNGKDKLGSMWAVLHWHSCTGMVGSASLRCARTMEMWHQWTWTVGMVGWAGHPEDLSSLNASIILWNVPGKKGGLLLLLFLSFSPCPQIARSRRDWWDIREMQTLGGCEAEAWADAKL